MRKLLLIVIFLTTSKSYSIQVYTATNDTINVNSIQILSDEELLRRIELNYSDTLKVKEFAFEYIKRGKRKNDSIMIARGFDRLCRMRYDSTSLKYTDSILSYTRFMNHRTYPSMAYTLKAHVYTSLNKISLAMDNYIMAYESSNNRLNKLYNKTQLLYLYYDWGSPKVILNKSFELLDETKQLSFEKEVASYVRSSISVNDSLINEERAYWTFNANDMICVSQLLLKDFQKARTFLKRNEVIASSVNNLDLKRRFKIRSAELDYYQGDFFSCIKIHDSLMNLYKSDRSKNNSHFYLGASYMKLRQYDKGLYHLEQLDSVLTKDNFITRDFLEMYEVLKNYYNEIGNKNKEIHYLNSLIEANNKIIETAASISPKYQQEFETPLLLAEKEKLIAQLEWEQGKEKRKQLFTVGLLFLSLGAGFYYFWKQNQYKKRFQALIKNGLEDQQELRTDQRRNDISAAIVKDILQKLERFESKHQFTRKDTSLQSVAKRFNTNSSYLSKVVNLKKDKNFSQYISELRIAYAVDQLKNNPRFRKYTIKAIAEEVGFGNAQSFSKAFYSRTGIQPSYFIRNLNKQKQADFIADSIPQTE